MKAGVLWQNKFLQTQIQRRILANRVLLKERLCLTKQIAPRLREAALAEGPPVFLLIPVVSIHDLEYCGLLVRLLDTFRWAWRLRLIMCNDDAACLANSGARFLEIESLIQIDTVTGLRSSLPQIAVTSFSLFLSSYDFWGSELENLVREASRGASPPTPGIFCSSALHGSELFESLFNLDKASLLPFAVREFPQRTLDTSNVDDFGRHLIAINSTPTMRDELPSATDTPDRQLKRLNGLSLVEKDLRLNSHGQAIQEVIFSLRAPLFQGREIPFFVSRPGSHSRGAEPVRLPITGIRSRPVEVVTHFRSGGKLIEAGSAWADFPPGCITPDMVICYMNRGGAGNDVIRAFAESIGARIRYAEDEVFPAHGVPVVWGVLRGSDLVLRSAAEHSQYFFYIDHAYFSRGHGKNYRITRNGFEAGAVRKYPSDRIAALGVKLLDWRKGGNSILVCPPTEYFEKAHGCETWLDDTLKLLRMHTDRPVEVRRKPKAGETVEPLDAALAKSHALVTHSSNVAVEAVIQGTPVFVSPTSAAAPVGCTDLSRIESPVYPDRNAWLAHLSYSQFTMDEIRSGEAWRMLRDHETRPLVL